MSQQVEVKVRLYGRFRRGSLLEVDFDRRTVTVQLLSWEIPQDAREGFNPTHTVDFRTLRAEDFRCLIQLQKGTMTSRDYYAKENR